MSLCLRMYLPKIDEINDIVTCNLNMIQPQNKSLTVSSLCARTDKRIETFSRLLPSVCKVYILSAGSEHVIPSGKDFSVV